MAPFLATQTVLFLDRNGAAWGNGSDVDYLHTTDSVGDNLSNVELKSLFTAYACILDMSARPIMMDFVSDRHFFFLGDSPSLSQFCTPVFVWVSPFRLAILEKLKRPVAIHFEVICQVTNKL